MIAIDTVLARMVLSVPVLYLRLRTLCGSMAATRDCCDSSAGQIESSTGLRFGGTENAARESEITSREQKALSAPSSASQKRDQPTGFRSPREET